jgi:hypothetical protein
VQRSPVSQGGLRSERMGGACWAAGADGQVGECARTFVQREAGRCDPAAAAAAALQAVSGAAARRQPRHQTRQARPRQRRHHRLERRCRTRRRAAAVAEAAAREARGEGGALNGGSAYDGGVDPGTQVLGTGGGAEPPPERTAPHVRPGRQAAASARGQWPAVALDLVHRLHWHTSSSFGALRPTCIKIAPPVIGQADSRKLWL